MAVIYPTAIPPRRVEAIPGIVEEAIGIKAGTSQINLAAYRKYER